MTPDEFIHDYETSGRTRGLNYTLSLIDRDAVYWFSDGSSHIGKNAIERVIRRNFELIKNEDYRIKNLVWVAQTSDSAVCIYDFEWSGVIRGAPASGSGRGTSVLVRRGVSWVVVREHLSKKEPVA